MRQKDKILRKVEKGLLELTKNISAKNFSQFKRNFQKIANLIYLDIKRPYRQRKRHSLFYFFRCNLWRLIYKEK